MALGQVPIPAGVPSAADSGSFNRYRTQQPNNPEDLWQPIYDRVNYPAAGIFELSFFAIPLGQQATLIRAGAAAAVAKTRRDTNLEQAGIIPDKQFLVQGISMTLIPLQQAVAAAGTGSIVDDQARLIFGGFMEIYLGDKPYLGLGLDLLPGTGILRGAVATTTATPFTIASGGGAGSGSAADAYWLKIPLTIDPMQSFRVRMQWDGVVALSQTFDIKLTLHGTMRRPG